MENSGLSIENVDDNLTESKLKIDRLKMKIDNNIKIFKLKTRKYKFCKKIKYFIQNEQLYSTNKTSKIINFFVQSE